jgi:hypothetical protein
MAYQRKTTKRAYSGILLEPIRADPALYKMVFEDPQTAETMRLKMIQGLRHARLKALATHFGLGEIDVGTPEGKERILWALAEEHVPGFKLAKTARKARGRPNTWGETMAFLCLPTVLWFSKTLGLSERGGCQKFLELLKDVPPFKDMTLDSFYARYKEMKKLEVWTQGGRDNVERYQSEMLAQAPEEVKRQILLRTKKR